VTHHCLGRDAEHEQRKMDSSYADLGKPRVFFSPEKVARELNQAFAILERYGIRE